MEQYLPLFPLNMVVFPTEKLNLHIFEPRYRQLINDISSGDGFFAIPPFLGNGISSLATEVKLMSIEKIYPSGEMDIKTKGVRVVQLLSFDNPALGKLYAGGNTLVVNDLYDEDIVVKNELKAQLLSFFKLIAEEVAVDFDSAVPISYQIGHKIGLTLEQELSMLTLNGEAERQEFIVEHLRTIIPMLIEVERTKERIRMNGHFKNLDTLDF